MPPLKLPQPIWKAAQGRALSHAGVNYPWRAISLAVANPSRYNGCEMTTTQPQKSRREVLEQFVAQKPGDAFARYGLALECAKLGDDAAAASHFQKLIEENPQYVAAYFQFGQFLERIGRVDEARKVLSDGIVMAAKTGDAHARGEMEAALSMLG